MISLKAKLIAAGIALTVVGSLTFAVWVQTKRVANLKQENALFEAQLVAERENLKKANEASERYAISLENLKAARAATPTRTVRLCVSPSVPEARTSPGADAPIREGLPQTPGPDIGEGLYSLADEADSCAVKLEALQDWIRRR